MNKKEPAKAFIFNDDIDWEIMDMGVKRKIMAYEERLMLVKVAFDKGSIGTLHNHFHAQITHVESGEFEVEIDGIKKTLKAGDAFYAASNLFHGVVCLSEGVLIDVFSPMREDFIK